MKTIGLTLLLCLNAPMAFAKPMTCRSWQGMEVPYLGDVTLETIGGATENARGRAVILLNPEILESYPPMAREFWLAHECGHHALTPAYNTEAEADCYAMRRLRKKLVRTPEQLLELQDALYALPDTAWSDHRPDEARIKALAQCGEE
ncbi:hypothetical protein [Shimia sp.]|uniref:hypothetical protein n=1 Tax=Shimia sp. TaxID=1954381 RepID=UPI0032976A57